MSWTTTILMQQHVKLWGQCFKPQIKPSFCRRNHHHPPHDCCWCTHWRFWSSHHLDTDKGNIRHTWRNQKEKILPLTCFRVFIWDHLRWWQTTAASPGSVIFQIPSAWCLHSRSKVTCNSQCRHMWLRPSCCVGMHFDNCYSWWHWTGQEKG